MATKIDASFFVALYFAVVATTSAQDVPQAAPKLVTSDKQEVVEGRISVVEIAGPREVERARSQTAARAVVVGEDLRRYGDTNINDALQRIPGVSVSNGSPALRGLGAGYTQVLIDGERPVRGFSLDTLALSTVERVEIYRVATAEFSTQAVAGSINIVLKKIATVPQGQINVGASNEYRPAGSIDWRGSATDGALASSLGLNARMQQSPFGAPQLDRTVTSDEHGVPLRSVFHTSRGDSLNSALSVTPRLTWALGKGSSVSSTSFISVARSHGTLRDEYMVQQGSPEQVDLALRRNEREAFSASTTLQLFRRLADEAKIDVKVGISGAQADARAALVGFDVAGAKVVGRDSETTLRSSGLTTSGKYSAPRMDEHDIVGGWSTSYTRSMNHTARAEMPGSDIASTDQQTKATIRNLAAFVQDEWNFSAGSSAYLGVRWEGIHVQNVELGNMTTSFDSGVWSPIVQGLWRLENKADQLRLGLARTYKAPESSMLISPREINVNNSALNPNFGGNSGLRPELAWALETALEHADPRKVTYNVRAYVRRIKDLQRLSTMLTEHGWGIMYVNAGVARSAGVEADIQFPLTLVTPLLGHTDVRASVARVRSRVDTAPGPDNVLEPNTVEASIGADYRAKAYPFTAGFGFKFANGGWQNLNRVERAFTTATRNLDAYGGWRFSKATQLRISVSNLLQADRSSRKTYHDEAQTVEFAGVASSYRLLRVSLEHKY